MKTVILSLVAGAVVATVLIYTYRFQRDSAREDIVEIKSVRPTTLFMPEQVQPPESEVIQSQAEAHPVGAAATEVAELRVTSDPPVTSERPIRLMPTSLGSAIENEPVDPVWSPAMEAHLRSYSDDFRLLQPEFGNRYSLFRVRCRSSVCEMLFLYNPEVSVADDSFRSYMRSIFDQEWSAPFNRRMTQWGGAVQEDGRWVQVLYLTTRESVNRGN